MSLPVHASATPAGFTANFRETLLNRCSEEYAPVAWKSALTGVGVAGADAFLCRLSRQIAAAIEAVSSSAADAREQLESARVAHPEVACTRFDELANGIAVAETSKVCALERELCACDAALECWRSERGAVFDVAAALGDADLAAVFAELTARLDTVDAGLLALPTTVVEPPYVGLVIDASALSAGLADFGRVLSPLAVTAADLMAESGPRSALSGTVTRLILVLQGVRHDSQSIDELALSLGAAAAATVVEASLQLDGSVCPLPVDTLVDISRRRILISIFVPAAAPAGSSIRIGRVTVSGQAVAGSADPFVIRVCLGVQAPLMLEYSKTYHAPHFMDITLAGLVLVPQFSSPRVLVFDRDGTCLPALSVTTWMGLSSNTCVAAYADIASSPALLLAEFSGATSRLVAVDPATQSVRWATAPGQLQGCGGLAVLPDHGVVVAESTDDATLCVHRLESGERVGGLRVPGLDIHLAGDPASGALFGNVWNEDNCEVVRFSFAPGAGVQAEGVISVAGEDASNRPLTVVPPAPGKRVSHLVVGALRRPQLLVLALPGLTLVHTHELEGIETWALAADPWGKALAVCDYASNSIHVLAWPLPGMPALE